MGQQKRLPPNLRENSNKKWNVRQKREGAPFLRPLCICGASVHSHLPPLTVFPALLVAAPVEPLV